MLQYKNVSVFSGTRNHVVENQSASEHAKLSIGAKICKANIGINCWGINQHQKFLNYQ
jgi:hypothetical protein